MREKSKKEMFFNFRRSRCKTSPPSRCLKTARTTSTMVRTPFTVGEHVRVRASAVAGFLSAPLGWCRPNSAVEGAGSEKPVRPGTGSPGTG